MKYALVGYGRMGAAIDEAAAARGHHRALIVDRSAKGRGVVRAFERARFRDIDVAFEFTEGPGAAERVAALLAAGVAVVCGTTGWDPKDRTLARTVRLAPVGAVVAPNFSVGMRIFDTLVDEAARAFARAGAFDPYVDEAHHALKKDAPSGTARRLAGIVEAASGKGPVPVASIRAGHEPGRHSVGFDGPHELVTLTHRARGRSGFALGAVLAAEWLRGRRGLHGFDEVCDELLRGTTRGRRGRRT